MKLKYSIAPFISGALIMLILSSCNALKFVPEDEKLYTGATVDIHSEDNIPDKSILQTNVRKVLSPKPNSKFLWMRVGLWSHYKMARGDSGFVTRFIYDKFGEDPVYLSDVQPNEVELLITNRAENSGFFYTEVNSAITEKKRTASLKYDLEVSTPYTLKTYHYNRDSLKVDKLIREYLQETSLEEGTRFDLDDFTDERKRIDNYLKNRGYYNFHPDYLIFTSDTNQYADRGFDLYLNFKDETPYAAQIPYRIKNVEVFPNYTLDSPSDLPVDSIYINDVVFIQDSVIFKPRHLYKYLDFEEGDLYNKEDDELTTRRLSILPIYQFANISYEKLDSLRNDTLGFLTATVRLTPGKQYDLRAKVQGVTKSNGFTGPGISGSFRNKNLFRGGEVWEINPTISYEKQIAGGSSEGLTTIQFKLNNSLTFPRLIAPFTISPKKKYTIPNTRFSLNYALQNRGQYYLLNSFFFSYGFNWRSSRFIFQEFSPLSLTYTRVTNKTEEFEDILEDNSFLARNFEDQFIPAILYTFRYSQIGEIERPSLFYFNFDADAAGNITAAVDKIAGGEGNILGIPYAQYLKGDIDFRYYYNFSEEKTLANRLFIGVGYPYGNSDILPYIKQYFAGGPNSIRAFRIRSLGPGNYQPEEDREFAFFDQSGDIRLEVNTEYRFHMTGLLDGAVFIDAGNIWLVNENPDVPGGKFGSDWFNELAIGTGYGFRIDIQFLVIRLDLAFPLRYPYQQEDGNYWQNDFSIWSPSWLRDNLVWNFAIGYPF